MRISLRRGVVLGREGWPLWAGVAVLVAMPVLAPTPYILHVFIVANIYAVFAASWDILSGYTGQLSLGHALFFGVGAYTAGLLSTLVGTPPLFNLFAGAFMAVLVGLLEGVPCLRLKGPYLGIVTLAFAEIAFSLAFALSSITGGEEGIIGIASLVRGSIYIKYYASLIFMLACTLALYALTRSKLGLILLAIKADDAAAEAAGVDTTRYKLLAFLISAFFGGLAGAYYAHYLNIANPETLAIPLSAAAITMTLVGGMGTIIGPVIGAYVLSLFFDLLPVVAGQVEFLTESRVLVYNVLIVLIVLFMPQGIVGWWRGRQAEPEVSSMRADPSRPQAQA